jgi:hypothetical protein
VFLELDEEKVRAWENRPEVRDREGALRAGHAAWVATPKTKNAKKPEFPGVPFCLLHSLSTCRSASF